MPLISLFTVQVVIKKPGTTTDRVGDTKLDWTNTIDTVEKCFVETVGVREEEFIRASEERTYKLFFEPDVDIQSEDRIALGPLTMEVVGPPMDRRTPSGVHHREVLAREYTG